MKQTIVFDFDGVIHLNYTGYKDGSIYGIMNWRLLDYIEDLLDDYRVVISSTRDPNQIVDYMKNLGSAIGSLKFEVFEMNEENKFWNKDYIVGVTNSKPGAILYIDDRALFYDPKKDTYENMVNIDLALGRRKTRYSQDQLTDEEKDAINILKKCSTYNCNDCPYNTDDENAKDICINYHNSSINILLNLIKKNYDI